VRCLERVGRETSASFDTHDFLVLDLVHREEQVPASLRTRLRRLLDLGVVEGIGRGRGARYFLSRRFYTMAASRGVYTRRRGLDRETNKELLLKHLRESPQGSAISELHGVLPGLSRANVQRLLDDLRQAGKVRLAGQRRGARWFATGKPGRAQSEGDLNEA
jgi:ATP-dependent DNA helicase RecG